MEKFRLFRDCLAISEPSVPVVETLVTFTKPAQLTRIRDILALYSNGQITPSLKTLPPDEEFRKEIPYANEGDVFNRVQNFNDNLPSTVKSLEERQKSFDFNETSPTSPVDAEGDSTASE